jgi:hypothetical protein
MQLRSLQGGASAGMDIILPPRPGGADAGVDIGLTERHSSRHRHNAPSPQLSPAEAEPGQQPQPQPQPQYGVDGDGGAESLGQLLLTLVAVSTSPDELESALGRAARRLEERPASTAAALSPALLEAGLARDTRRRTTARAVLARLLARGDACRGPLLHHFCAVVDGAAAASEGSTEEPVAGGQEDRVCLLGVAVAARAAVQKALDRELGLGGGLALGEPAAQPNASRATVAGALGVMEALGEASRVPPVPGVEERWATEVVPWLGLHRAVGAYLHTAVAAVSGGAGAAVLPPTRLCTALAECGLAILRLAAEVASAAARDRRGAGAGKAAWQERGSGRAAASGLISVLDASGQEEEGEEEEEEAVEEQSVVGQGEALRREAAQGGVLAVLGGWLSSSAAAAAAAAAAADEGGGAPPDADAVHLVEKAEAGVLVLVRALSDTAGGAEAWAGWLRCVGWECAALRSRRQLTAALLAPAAWGSDASVMATAGGGAGGRPMLRVKELGQERSPGTQKEWARALADAASAALLLLRAPARRRAAVLAKASVRSCPALPCPARWCADWSPKPHWRGEPEG